MPLEEPFLSPKLTQPCSLTSGSSSTSPAVRCLMVRDPRLRAVPRGLSFVAEGRGQLTAWRHVECNENVTSEPATHLTDRKCTRSGRAREYFWTRELRTLAALLQARTLSPSRLSSTMQTALTSRRLRTRARAAHSTLSELGGLAREPEVCACKKTERKRERDEERGSDSIRHSDRNRQRRRHAETVKCTAQTMASRQGAPAAIRH